MITHIAHRIAFVILGYLAAVAVGSAAFPLAIVLIGQLFPESEVWAYLGFGAIVLLVAPVVFLFVFWFVAVSTIWQAIAVHLATEYFGLRQLWLHLAVPIAIMLNAVFMFDATWFADMSFDRWLITLRRLARLGAGGAGLLGDCRAKRGLAGRASGMKHRSSYPGAGGAQAMGTGTFGRQLVMRVQQVAAAERQAAAADAIAEIGPEVAQQGNSPVKVIGPAL